MMTTTMLFLMRNMEKSGNQVLRTISTWMKSKLHEGWQLTFNQKKLNKRCTLFGEEMSWKNVDLVLRL